MSRLRTRNSSWPRLWLLSTGTTVVLALSAGCAVSPQASPDVSATSGVAAAPDATSAAAQADTTGDAAVEPTPVVPPTPVPTPTPRPTPRPLPTPIPPSKALMPAATALETKLTAFRTALKTQDVADSLRLQRELLSASTETETAIKDDKSPEAQAVRAAIAGIRAGLAGDSNGLEHANTALRQVIGGTTGAALGVTVSGSDTAPDPINDLHTLNVDLHNFRQAVQSSNSGDALRLQAKLVADIATLQKTAATDQSGQSKALSDALGTLQKGLDGDSTSLVVAGAALDKLDIGPGGVKPTIDYAGLAASLAAKMDAFETATSSASQSDLLRLQQEILNEATQDEAALGSEQTPQATALRDAIKGARASASGDLSKLDSARSDLGKVSGQAAAPGASTAKPITDIKGFAGDLDKTIGSFQDALDKNDTQSMLRIQKSLADQADQADASLRGVNSKPAQQVLAAVATVRTAFAGDTSKLADARVQLRQVSGSSATPGTTTKPGSTSTASSATGSNSTGADVPTLAKGVNEKLTYLNDAVKEPRQSPEEIAKRRDALNTAALQAEAALKGSNDPRSDKLRAALITAREAATGDDAKAQSASSALQSALNGQ